MNEPSSTAETPHAAPLEALGMMLLCFGWFIVSSLQSLGPIGVARVPRDSATACWARY